MKPDQHKKKRSAQYKRKHETAQKKEATDTSDSKTKSNSKHKNVKATTPSTSSSCTSKLESSATSAKPSSGSQSVSSQQLRSKDFTPDESEEVKRFSRRKIESNWARYEPLEDEDDSGGLRGADFKTLLTQTGDASSQFRFKDEQLWDQEETDISREQESGGLPAIDCHVLAQRLMAVPLQVRLNIEDSFFEPSMLKSFEEAAQRHKEKLDGTSAKRMWTSGNPAASSLVFTSTNQFMESNADEEAMEGGILLDAEDEKTAAGSGQPREENTQDLSESPTGPSLDDVKDFVLCESSSHQDISLANEVQNAPVVGEDAQSKFSEPECLFDVTSVADSEQTEIVPENVDKGDDVGQFEETRIDTNVLGKEHQEQDLPSPKMLGLTPDQQQNQMPVTRRTAPQAQLKNLVKSPPMHNTKAKAQPFPEPTDAEDDELDFLLSLENPVQASNKPVVSQQKEVGWETGHEEEQRSPPNDSHHGDMKSVSPPSPVKSAPSVQTGLNSESLEDWLDSVLED